MMSPTLAYRRRDPPLMRMHKQLASAGIVGHLESCLHLYHRSLPISRGLVYSARSSTLIRRQRLVLRQRPALAHQHRVADAGLRCVSSCAFSRLVRRTTFLYSACGFTDVTCDDDGLLHLVGDDDALPFALLGFALSRPSQLPRPFSRRLCTVMIRAMSWRTWRRRLVFSSCPVACWNRRLNSSSRDCLSRWSSSSSASSTMILSLQGRRPPWSRICT